MDPIINSIRRYIGTGHPWARNQRVVVVSVARVIDGESQVRSLACSSPWSFKHPI